MRVLRGKKVTDGGREGLSGLRGVMGVGGNHGGRVEML